MSQHLKDFNAMNVTTWKYYASPSYLTNSGGNCSWW